MRSCLKKKKRVGEGRGRVPGKKLHLGGVIRNEGDFCEE